MVAIFKPIVMTSAVLSMSILMAAGTALAADSKTPSDTASVPITITLTDVIVSDVPLYISVQTKENYRSVNGQGTILEATPAGVVTETIHLPSKGDYAVSVWHDLDNDGQFSMNERYEIKDGWATSGDVPVGTSPTFESTKITVPSYGIETSLAMIYPDDAR